MHLKFILNEEATVLAVEHHTDNPDLLQYKNFVIGLF
jgi:hypothetical protein